MAAEPLQFAVKTTVCDKDYEHLTGPTGISMFGCRPKNTIVFNTVADWDGVKSDLAYAGLFQNYEDSSTHLALLSAAACQLQKVRVFGVR